MALRASKSVELLTRLTKEGLNDDDRLLFDATLCDVAQQKQNSSPPTAQQVATGVAAEFELKYCLFSLDSSSTQRCVFFRPSSWTEVRSDWPFYSKWDAEVVKKNLAAKLLQSSSLAKHNPAALDVIGCKSGASKTRVVPPSRKDVVAAPKDSAPENILPSEHFSSPLDTIMPVEVWEQENTSVKKRVAQKRSAESAAQSGAKRLNIVKVRMMSNFKL